MLAPQAPLSGALNLGGNIINNIANPIAATDAVNYQTLVLAASYYLATASFNSWTGSGLSNFAGTASIAKSSSVAISAQTASYFLTSSVTSASFSVTSSYSVASTTASYVSGAITNIGDAYPSVGVVMRIVSLTAAEYAALGAKDANTFYAVV